MANVLVVDDSPVDRRLVGRLIEKIQGTKAYYAENGKQALERIEEHLPDLVVTDMQMPEMDGFELVQVMKTQYPLLPVILVTAAGSEAIAVRALGVGASSYVPKISLAEDLIDTVERVLSMSNSTRSQARLKNRIRRSVIEYEIETDRELVLALSTHLREQLSAMGICSEKDSLRTGISIEEALLNAFYHGNLEVSSKLKEENWEAYVNLASERCREMPYMARRIFVTSSMSSDEASWVIRDEGQGFDVSKLPDPRDPEYLERPHGRGLMLMKTFMDEVTYNDKGNEVRLVKRRTSPSVD